MIQTTYDSPLSGMHSRIFCNGSIFDWREPEGGDASWRLRMHYDVVASYDRQHWFRIKSSYDGNALSWTLTPEQDAIYFAYFAPYSLERHYDLVARVGLCSGVRSEALGLTIDGRALDCLHFEQTAEKSQPDRAQVWAIARQHPGESMAQWWMEGYLQRLLNNNDAVAQELLTLADFYIVPNMNPDGSFRGHLRTNAAGVNLNREWDKTTMESSPEVYHVLNRMRETGVSFNLDVHGDEALPYNFIAGTEGIKSWNEDRLALQELFKSNLMRINPAFQTTVGYPVSAAMPFKDNVLDPDLQYGWSAHGSSELGASCLEAIHSIIGNLKPA